MGYHDDTEVNATTFSMKGLRGWSSLQRSREGLDLSAVKAGRPLVTLRCGSCGFWYPLLRPESNLGSPSCRSRKLATLRYHPSPERLRSS
jgi:hypothetical protein